MPRRPPTPCRRPGCPGLVQDGACSRCGAVKRNKAREMNRPSARKRGYTTRWDKYRAVYLRQNPLCVRCRAHGIDTPATVVHHRTPVQGEHDPLFWEATNHAALCRECHEIIHKRRREAPPPG